MQIEFREEWLREFVNEDDKEPPPVFVGRGGVIGDILKAADRAWNTAPPGKGRPGATRIVSGAPGAGKSSVLAELERRCRKDAKRKHAPRVLKLSAAQFSNVGDVLQGMAEAVGPKKADRLFAEESRSSGGHVSAKVAGYSSGRATAAPAATPTLAALASWAKKRKVNWDYPLIVAIDEAQNLRPSNSAAAALLQTIHEAAAGRPLTLVLAGLGDVPQRAEEMGLTHGLKLHPLGGLEPLETAELAGRFCGYFGIAGDGLLERLLELAAACENWPSHLHHALQAFGKAVLDVGGRTERLRWDRIAARAAGSRIDYYGRQRGEAMRDSGQLTAAVMRGLDRHSSAEAVLELIDREAARHPLPPACPDAYSFRRHLVHQGALQPDAHGAYHSPIPSFRGFLSGEGWAERVTRAAGHTRWERSDGTALVAGPGGWHWGIHRQWLDNADVAEACAALNTEPAFAGPDALFGDDGQKYTRPLESEIARATDPGADWHGRPSP